MRAPRLDFLDVEFRAGVRRKIFQLHFAAAGLVFTPCNKIPKRIRGNRYAFSRRRGERDVRRTFCRKRGLQHGPQQHTRCCSGDLCQKPSACALPHGRASLANPYLACQQGPRLHTGCGFLHLGALCGEGSLRQMARADRRSEHDKALTRPWAMPEGVASD